MMRKLRRWGMPGKAKPNTTVLISASVVALLAFSARGDEASDMSSHHHHVAPQITAASVQYTVPDVTLTRADGATVSLAEEINDGRPVMLNFIYTSCTSVCPLMSQMFALFERNLGADRGDVHLMSISIDPEADTPARLTEYAERFGAGPEWHFYTGTIDASIKAQRAFDVYRGDKMKHAPVTLIRVAPGQPWRRIDGFAKPDELMQEYRQQLAAR
jgi:protein SCO1/2